MTKICILTCTDLVEHRRQVCDILQDAVRRDGHGRLSPQAMWGLVSVVGEVG